MRLSSVLLITCIASTASADPVTVRGEVIRVRDPKPPRPLSDLKTRLPYSDAAVLGDAWAKAWLLLEIDDGGKVARVAVLHRPGYELEPIAVRESWKLAFEPARDPGDQPTTGYLLWGVEWPSVGWLNTHVLPATARLTEKQVEGVACKGSDSLDLDKLYPVFRDCTPAPKLDDATLAKVHWYKRPGHTAGR